MSRTDFAGARKLILSRIGDIRRELEDIESDCDELVEGGEYLADRVDQLEQLLRDNEIEVPA